jgi:hypothetical protein
MAKITLEISDELMSRLEQRSSSLQEIVTKALETYLETESLEITQTLTWQLCGSLEISELDPQYILGKDNQGRVITNYAENTDQVLY